MKITNKMGLPEVLVDAVLNDPYDPGESDISVTRLIAPPRMVALTKKHYDEIERDVSDMLFALMGQAMHHILERAGDPDGTRIIEKRLFAEVSGWVLSGQLDIWEEQVLSDYKFTSVWETIHGLKEEKIAQLNILGWLCRQNGIPTTTVQIIALYRDWSRTKAKFERDYPQGQVGILEAEVWSDEKCLAYIEERIKAHQDAETTLPECTDEEQWRKPTKYALMKEGRKTALKLEDTPEDLLLWADKHGHCDANMDLWRNLYIEKRPGERTRCESYCDAAPFCSQFNGS